MIKCLNYFNVHIINVYLQAASTVVHWGIPLSHYRGYMPRLEVLLGWHNRLQRRLVSSEI